MKKFKRYKTRLSYSTVAIVAVIFGAVGLKALLASHAAPAAGTLYMSSSSTAYNIGDTFTVDIRENSGTTTVNGVEADLTYPTSQLQYVSTDATTSAFDTAGPSSTPTGAIDLARLSTTGVTGDQLIATLTFKVLAAGNASVAFATTSAVATPQGQQESNNTPSLALTLSNPSGGGNLGTGSLSLTSSTNTYNVGDTVTVTIREDSGTTAVNGVEADFTYPAADLQYVSTDATGSAFDTTGPTSTPSGSVNIARLNSTGGVTGDQLVATVTFKALAASTAQLSFASTAAVATPQGQSEASNFQGLTLTLSNPTIPANGTLYLSSGATTYNVGDTVTVSIREDSAATTVNGVEADVTFPATELQYQSSDGTGSAFDTAGPTSTGTGTVNLARLSTTGVTGDQLVATVTFKALAAGAANIAFANTSAVATPQGQSEAGTFQGLSLTISNPADTTPPSAPTTLAATATSSTQIQLSWIASTDNVAVTGYTVSRNGTKVGTTATTSFTDSGLTPNTPYAYTVTAQDAAGNSSTASNVANATTQEAPDTTPPSAPTSLTATANSPTQVKLTWTASTDDVGVTAYLVLRDSSVIATVTTTSYTDNSVAANTDYSYQIEAQDAAHNTSSPSNTATVTTPNPPDTTPPSVPTGVQATAASTTQVNVTWNASADNVGVAGYTIFRDGTKLGTSTTTSFGDATASADTTYSYTVSAFDGANNASNQSTAVNVTTPANGTLYMTASPTTYNVGDTVTVSIREDSGSVPVNGVEADITYPTNELQYQSTDVTGSAYDTTGSSSTPTGGVDLAMLSTTPVTGDQLVATVTFKVLAAGTANIAFANTAAVVDLQGRSEATTFQPLTLTLSNPVINPTGTLYLASSSTNYNVGDTFTVDIRENSGTTKVNGVEADVTYPTNLLQYVQTDTTNSAFDTAGPNSTPSGAVDQARLSTTGVTGDQLVATLTFKVLAAGNASVAFANTSAVATPQGQQEAGTFLGENLLLFNPADTTPPTAPGNLVATATGTDSIDLTWSTSTDNVGVTEYVIFRDGSLVGVSTTPSFTDSGLNAGTAYSYYVIAQDATSNSSNPSNTAMATTDAAADTTPPSDPANLAANATGPTQVKLTWDASTDNVGVATYFVVRDGSVIAQLTAPATSFTDNTVAAGTSYDYQIEAQDDALNTSNPSNTATVTTPNPADITPPSVPTGLLAFPISSTQVNLAWNASTDNVGVAGYTIFRNNIKIGQTTTASFGDATVNPGILYSYTVSAFDAAGNTSALSVPATAVTRNPQNGGGGNGDNGGNSGNKNPSTIHTTPSHSSGSVKITSPSSPPITAPDQSQVTITTPIDIEPTVSDSITRVQYYLNNKLVHTTTDVPFAYHVDMMHLLNGKYTLKTVSYYSSGRTVTSSQQLVVKNPFSFTQFLLLLEHYLWLVILVLLIVLVGIVVLLARRGRGKWTPPAGFSNPSSTPPTTVTPAT